MGKLTPHLCSEPYCPAVVEGARYCEAHRKARRAEETPRREPVA